MKGKRWLFTAIGMGATYLLKNKTARRKIGHALQSFSRAKK
ncbi:hypothetical protein [Paenibacillus sp. 1011MAR3C5]|nr:hypothetical protein [Paenibacillus sp. 1011MAR3C5]